MCGRAILVATIEVLEELFALTEVPDLVPRFNIAPTQPIAVIRAPHRLELLRWGISLPGAKVPKINLRIESVVGNPATRELTRTARCLVIIDGFYEWKREGKLALPFLFRHPDAKPFAIGGVWARSPAANGETIDSCAMITRAGEGAVKELHDRMPFIVPPSDYDRWLDPTTKAKDLLAAPADLSLVSRPVSKRVNSPANDDVGCLGPPDVAQGTLF